MLKFIRTIGYFTQSPSLKTIERLQELSLKLQEKDYLVQTQRICSNGLSIKGLNTALANGSEEIILSVGRLGRQEAWEQLDDFFEVSNTSFHLQLLDQITLQDVDLLFEIITKAPKKTFNFTYTFHNATSSPFFPAACYQKEGFSIGLQCTNLAEGCTTLEQWFDNMQTVWQEIEELFKNEPDYLGIDSSIAPLYNEEGSFLNFIKKLYPSLGQAATSPVFTKISNYIKTQNPNPVGLCGLMFPCLEDFELAEAYEKGEFSIERNIFLSLHSGLGIDTYPIGIDESKERVLEVLQLVQQLSIKYKKPLAARFISDGKSKIGEQTDFQNPFLKDVLLRKL
ncbi:MAG: DUF711 family protein [Aureispira sp.]|nr:DUF711 family protein [Aureispira sp.]